ncbi:hypothetical protein [Thermomonospora umbrina]|uniref:hypothetical protein n=1 Tax=Thermomonospora umbrina TaxID=111806 RepID=UPI003CCC4BDA
MQGSDGSTVTVPGLPEETFTTQADAETWLGVNWRELRAGGVERVALLEDDAVVYPMSLLDPE